MAIHWYPGHMHKASKEIKEALPKVDLFIEVLDARIPFSSENPVLTQLRGVKPVIKILNKSDLADPLITQQWQDYLEKEKGVKTLALTSSQPERIRQILELCRKLLPNKQGKIIHAMIMGIPNVGKSTIINILAGRTIAKTGNEPAVTKAQQRIDLSNNIVLHDTPGVLWPKIHNPHSGYRLAVTGAIKDTAMEYEDVAFYAVDYLLKAYPQNLMQRYELDSLPQTELEFLEQIGAKRGCLRSGGQVDLNKISKLLLTELRAGTIGVVSLETPAMREAELQQLVIEEQKQAELKAARSEQKSKKRRKR
ncbi:MAG: ribosome biogenesis GTPase YlqF [Gammaproteobacteria bacterium]|nr:ribosome biogenesis GTPase YlqF [Gammaproteobacteria bacterium]